MRNIAKAIVFLALVSAAGSARAAAFKISIALPAEALIIDDLDARDAFNRPIPKSAARAQLVELFSRTLNRMLLNSLTPLRVKTLALLNAPWDGFAGLLQTARRAIWHPAKSWWSEKRYQLKISTQIFSVMLSPPSLIVALRDSGNPFSNLIQFVISSTRLLR